MNEQPLVISGFHDVRDVDHEHPAGEVESEPALTIMQQSVSGLREKEG